MAIRRVRRRRQRYTAVPFRYMLQAEKKHIDYNDGSIRNIGNSSANTSYAWACNPGQGSSISTRTGDAIMVQSCEINLMFVCNQTNLTSIAGQSSGMRLILVKTRDPAYQNNFNTSVATVTSAIESALFDNGGVSPYTTAVRKLQFDMTVLKDRAIGLHNFSGSTAARVYHVKTKIAVNQKIRFVPGGTTSGSGSVILYLVSNDGTTVMCGYNGTVRWHFVDTS